MTTGKGTTGNGHDTTPDERDQFIPVRKSDILDALVENGQLGDEPQLVDAQQGPRGAHLCGGDH